MNRRDRLKLAAMLGAAPLLLLLTLIWAPSDALGARMVQLWGFALGTFFGALGYKTFTEPK